MSSPYNNFEDRFIQLSGLEVPGLPETLGFEGDSFVRKPEFHITLLSVDNTAALIDVGRVEELRPQIVDEFHRFVGSQPLTDYELTDDVRLVEAGDDNKTIVVMAAMKGLRKFFEELSERHGVPIPVQPAHITLYTLPSDRFGIPINSYEQLEEISTPVEIPDIQRVL